MNLYSYKGFALAKNDRSPEAMQLVGLAMRRDIPIIRADYCPEHYVPCGSVEYCLGALNDDVYPDYYPMWAAEHLYRNVWAEEKFPVTQRVFIKPLLNYKRWNGFITTGNSYKGKKRGPYQCSDVVSFTNEWRYYITNGKAVDAGWYWGDEVNTPDAPEFPVHPPDGWCGTVDMGTLSTGELAVVECHHPFACGMYSKNYEAYFQWLIDGWRYMNHE